MWKNPLSQLPLKRQSFLTCSLLNVRPRSLRQWLKLRNLPPQFPPRTWRQPPLLLKLKNPLRHLPHKRQPFLTCVLPAVRPRSLRQWLKLRNLPPQFPPWTWRQPPLSVKWKNPLSRVPLKRQSFLTCSPPAVRLRSLRQWLKLRNSPPQFPPWTWHQPPLLLKWQNPLSHLPLNRQSFLTCSLLNVRLRSQRQLLKPCSSPPPM